MRPPRRRQRTRFQAAPPILSFYQWMEHEYGTNQFAFGDLVAVMSRDTVIQAMGRDVPLAKIEEHCLRYGDDLHDIAGFALGHYERAVA